MYFLFLPSFLFPLRAYIVTCPLISTLPATANDARAVLLTLSTSNTTPSQTDHSLVKYWYRCNWIKHQKDKKEVSSVSNTAPRRGNARAAEGGNVMMLSV